MKHMLIVFALVATLSGCGHGTAEKANSTDSGGLTNPTAIDTTKHPSGVDNSSVISTDTAAMNMQNSIEKGDSAKKKSE